MKIIKAIQIQHRENPVILNINNTNIIKTLSPEIINVVETSVFSNVIRC